MRYSYGKCFSKKNIRSYSIFGLHDNLQGRVMLKIFQLFIITKLNASQISYYIMVCKVLNNIRHTIAYYSKYR